MAIAEEAIRVPGSLHVLCLERPKMSQQRIEAEWRLANRVFRPEVLERLAVRVLHRDGSARSLGALPPPLAEEACRGMEPRRETGQIVRLPPPDFHFIILKLFVHAWLTHRGPLTARWIAQTAGCSYPTVASATRRIGRAVVRRKDRRLELQDFPSREWARLLLAADEARSTVRFADRSGQPRSTSSLTQRLEELRPPHLAKGGVLGARWHWPDLDLSGLPRLDVSVHCPGRAADLSFVRQLDPALEATADPHEPPRLVVHFVRHKDPLFEQTTDTLPWADAAECLMDLHEAGLETQAAEFARALGARSREVG
jgi:hypothetical protein